MGRVLNEPGAAIEAARGRDEPSPRTAARRRDQTIIDSKSIYGANTAIIMNSFAAHLNFVVRKRRICWKIHCASTTHRSTNSRNFRRSVDCSVTTATASPRRLLAGANSCRQPAADLCHTSYTNFQEILQNNTPTSVTIGKR